MIMRILMLLGGLSACEGAAAHTGLGIGDGFAAGFMHPLLGFDHLLAAIAVGLWAVRHEGPGVRALPVAFLLSMGIGVAFAINGVALPAVEPAIVLSLVVFGAGLALPGRAPLGIAAALLAGFGFFHGHAHGAAAPASFLAYGSGLVLTTALLHLAGIVAGCRVRPRIRRVAGAVIIGSGVLLAAI